MKLTILLPLLALCAVGCTAAIPAPEKPEEEPEIAAPREIDQDTSGPSRTAEEAGPGATADDADGRAPGDWVEFAFSGSYRKAPLGLTERVVAKDAESITIDFAFKDGKSTETLRVKTATVAGRRGEILSVEAIGADGAAKPSTREAFEARMAETVAVADSNDALLDETTTNVKVGDRDLSGTLATYRVRVGKKSATLRAFTAEGFEWGDAGGEIKTADGELVYKAELTGMGGDRRSAALDL